MLREPIEDLLHGPETFTKHVRFPDATEIRLYDETLRDGEQMPGVCYTPSQKLELAKALVGIGVHILSVGFPAASLSDQKTLQLIVDAKRTGDLGNVELVVMCRSNRADIDVAIDTLQDIGAPASAVTYLLFTSASDLHIKYKLGRALLRHIGRDDEGWRELPLEIFREANIQMQCDAIKYAKARGAESIEFGVEDGSRGDVDYYIKFCRECIASGATRAIWADTVGALTPEATRWYATRIITGLPEGFPVVAHFHNDFGLATINAITAAASGFKTISVTANGYGERAGNVKLHELVVALRILYGVTIPGFDYSGLRSLARLLECYSGMPLQSHEPIVGLGVFAHESGIHTSAMLIDERMYQAVPPAMVGGSTDYVFGKHSGVTLVEETLNANSERLAAAGVAVSSTLAHAVTDEIKRLREERAEARAGADSIKGYYDTLRTLWLNEDDVVAIALALNERPALLS
jgi:isopropylmalate/homocitrate/citramalate synthase